MWAVLKVECFFQFRFSFWVTICKVFHLMLSDRCPVCLCVLSVTLVYCGQMVGWIKMKLGVEVGLSPGHIVLDGDPAPPKGAQPPIFGPYLLRPNGWMDQDATWYEGRPQPWPHWVRWGLVPRPKRGHSPPPIFIPYLLWPNGRPSQLLLSTYCMYVCLGLAFCVFFRFNFYYLWSPYVIGQTVILSSCFFLRLLFLFPRLISAVGDWMSTILPHMVWP